jgi:hypothetical protein
MQLSNGQEKVPHVVIPLNRRAERGAFVKRQRGIEFAGFTPLKYIKEQRLFFVAFF